MKEASQYNIPKEPGRWRALLLAALVHLLLLGLLWFGVSWQNETPVAVEAEVWDVQVKEAAPPRPPPPPVEVKPVPAPAPVPKPVEAPPVITPPAPKPDIALEQEKKRKEEARKRAEQAQKEKLAEQAQQEKLAEQKKLAEQRKREQAAAELAKKRKQEEEQRKQAAAEQKQKELDEAEARAADARHQENVKRLQAQAQAGGAGAAVKSQGPRAADPSYVQQVGAKIKSNTTYSVPPGLSGNPPVEYDVQLMPDGSLRGMRKTRSSGVPGFDDAVARAIERSQPFPRDSTGAVPGGFTLAHRPKDQ